MICSGEEPKSKDRDIDVQTDENYSCLSDLQAEIIKLKTELKASQLRLANIMTSPEKVHFYTGFQNYATLKIFYDSLGAAVDHLNYWGSEIIGVSKSPRGRNRSLSPMEEFFLVMVRIRLGLFEKDLAYRFGISTSTMSCICITWINFLFIKLKELPLWANERNGPSTHAFCV